jgi:hypothetical protein
LIQARGQSKLTEALKVLARTIARPAVELSLVFELLAAKPRNDKEAAGSVRQGCHVTPKPLELGHWENVFLRISPALLYFLQGDVGGHTRSKPPHASKHGCIIYQISAAQAEACK